jgi:hypothetical protein
MSEVTVSLMQPTFIKENPVLSGKFTVSLGKKLGCGELQLDESPEGQEKLLNAIEGAANRMIQQAPTLCTTRLSKQEILETYGEHVLDASHKKNETTRCVKCRVYRGRCACSSAGSSVCFHIKLEQHCD